MVEASLSPELITRNLPTRFIGQKVIHYPSLKTTMEAAKSEALWGAPAGTIVVADEQTAGKGRFQRLWISPPGSLTLSVILRPNIEYLPYMIMIASLSVANCIQQVTGLKPQIKWPNDVLIHEKKVCGILIENDIRQNSLKHTLIGIGINVNMQVSKYPEIVNLATSLSDQVGQTISRLDLLRQLLIEMDSLYSNLTQKDLIFTQWKNRLITLGRNVEVQINDRVYHGKGESVHIDGSLDIRLKDNRILKVLAGDVTLKLNGEVHPVTPDLPLE